MAVLRRRMRRVSRRGLCGSLLQDFAISEIENTIHAISAPSPRRDLIPNHQSLYRGYGARSVHLTAIRE